MKRRSKTQAVWGLGAAAVTLILPFSAQADTTITLSAADQGWYTDQVPTVAGGDHPNQNNGGGPDNNYLVGEDGGSEYRDWFSFNLNDPRLAGERVTGATLDVANTTDGFPMQTIALYDVSTPNATLKADNDGPNVNNTYLPSPTETAIYNDLGSGNSYGAFTVSAADDSALSLALNAQGVSDVNAALGSASSGGDGYFSVGGTLENLSSPYQYIFGEEFLTPTQPITPQNSMLTLTLTSDADPSDASAAPEPAEWATLSMIMLGLSGLALKARKASKRLQNL